MAFFFQICFCQIHPKLLESLQKVVAQRVQLPSKKDELLGNFKLSVRGSIRKSPNVMPGAQMFRSWNMLTCSSILGPVENPPWILLSSWISSILQLQALDPSLDVSQFVQPSV
jgi:hypothetical protein